MKKLTAGIFATILGLTAVDAFAAVPTGKYNVASVKYVNEAMNAVSGDVSGLAGRVSANETAISTLNGEQDSQDLAIKAAADAAAAAQSAADAAQGEVDALEGVVEGLSTASGNYATKTELTDGLAAKVDNSTYTTDKATLESSISAAAAKGEQGIADAATAQAAAEAADAKAVAAQGEVDALEEVVATKANASELTNYVNWEDVDDTYVENEYTF